MINIQILKEIARNRVRLDVKTENDLIEFLKVWWSNKYTLPDNHPLFLSKTLEEHVIDYYIDKFVSNPESMNEVSQREIEQDEEKLKEVMGDEYHEEYDYLVPPTSAEMKAGKAIEKKEQETEDFDESFEDVNHTQD